MRANAWLRSRWLVAASAAAIAVAVTAAAQTTFPVRFEDEATMLVEDTSGLAVMVSLRLEPLDEPPVTCGNAQRGLMYVQSDVGNVITGSFAEEALCVCMKCGSGCTGLKFADSGFTWASMGGQECGTLQPEP